MKSWHSFSVEKISGKAEIIVFNVAINWLKTVCYRMSNRNEEDDKFNVVKQECFYSVLFKFKGEK